MEGAGGELKAGNTIHWVTNRSVVRLTKHRNSHSQHMTGRDGHWQQFDTPCSPINAPKWLYIPCSGLSWFYIVGKMLPVKADLAIYSPVIGMSG